MPSFPLFPPLLELAKQHFFRRYSREHSSSDSSFQKGSMMDLHGRVALITGASSGIGYVTALRIAEAGADIAIGYQRKQQTAYGLTEHIRQMGRRALAVHGDLRKPAEVLALVDRTQSELGPIDILINNAGMGNRKRLEEL